MFYGLPYMGSKNAIAKQIVDFLPNGKRFIDLFGGGGAITHYVLKEIINNQQCSIWGKKYESILYNDFNPIVVDYFKKAVNGFYKNETRWISREDFCKLKNIDPYVKFCWSFGNDGRTYLYSSQIEPYKKACHYAIVFDDWDLLKELCPEVWQVAYNSIKNIKNIKQRRLNFAPPIVKKLKRLNNFELVLNNPLYKSCHLRGGLNISKKQSLQSLESLQSLQRLERLQSLQSLERLQRLQSLERLQRLQRLEITNISYTDYKYKDGDIVYCDIPYENTHNYDNVNFDYQNFYNWVYNQPYTVYFSSYNNLNDVRFNKKIIAVKNQTLSATNNSKKVYECIYWKK